MAKRVLSSTQFFELTRPLIGLPVSRTWRGYGSAIFFELGLLTSYESKRRDGEVRIRSVGEITLMIEWSWRVEKPRSIAFGSWNSKRQIENGIQKLQGSIVEGVELEGRLPEIVIALSGGRWVHSFMTVESQPQWGVLWKHAEHPQQRSSWIHCDQGKLVLVTDD